MELPTPESIAALPETLHRTGSDQAAQIRSIKPLRRPSNGGYRVRIVTSTPSSNQPPTHRAPTGTVTFLFTDIEGSTRLWDHHPTAMTSALATHDQILGSVVAMHDGYVFSQAGDGWGIAFPSALNALDAALTIQETLGRTSWPQDVGSIRIRMGLHTGTASERDGDYFGTTVNRAARVSGVADGGQIFVTDAVRTLVADERDSTWRFRDLGEHRLRDLSRPERIWQLDSTEAPADLATLTRQQATGNIPRQRMSIIGRDTELEQIAESIRNASLVTLVGVGGVGKTTLAKAVGAEIADQFQSGAWFVDLTATHEAEQIVATVATALDIAKRPDMSTLDSIADSLISGQRLVILDNAEHQIDAVANFVDEILIAVSNAKLVVTSREPLNVAGEQVHRIGPLDAIGAGGTAPAVQLFTERASAVAPDLDAAAFDTVTIEQICQRLDGLPLAIELAASQSETMTPAEILRALIDDDLDIQSTSRSAVQRHRSLTEVVAWSYNLLTPTEQTVFQRLSAFTGGCTMDAAVAVCSGDTVSGSDVRTAIATLVRKSMIATNRTGTVTRLTMLETLRHFAAVELSRTDQAQAVAERHAVWFGQRSTESRDGMVGPDEAAVLADMLADLDNLQAASRWACENGHHDIMTDLGRGLPHLMGSKMRPSLTEWIIEGINGLPPQHPARVDYAVALAHSTLFSGDMEGAPIQFADATAEIADRLDIDVIQRYLNHLSHFFAGDIEYVLADGIGIRDQLFEREMIREAGAVGTDLSLCLLYAGETDRARTLAADSHALATRTGNPSLLAWSLYSLGEIDGELNPTASIDTFEESIEYGLSVDNEFVAGISLIALSSVAGRNGDMTSALDAMTRCITLWRTAGNRPQMWTAARNLVEMLHRLGMNGEALTLHFAVEADAEKAPALFGPFGDQYLAMVATIEKALGPDESVRATRSGSSMAYAEAAQYALDVIAHATTSATALNAD